jgi:chromosomal replication initiator protein
MESRSAREIWDAALGELQVQVSKPNYRTWLEKTVGLSFQDNNFVVGVPNTFVAEYLDKNQRSLIEKTLMGIARQDVKLTFSVDGKHHNLPEHHSYHQATALKFNQKYTFDSFIEGSCNRLARAAALRVAEDPGHSYNPLFIYGGSGLGKTHLLQAIGQKAEEHNIQVLYVSGEQFTNEFVSAIRERKMEEFNNKYRSVQMLLIDDIHFISGKEQTEECFFHTFNELHNANHQIALTSDRPPKSLPLLEARLRSRFEWGLIVDIQPPDFETRLAILQAKAARDGEEIAPEVLEFITQQAQNNVRELEGSLNRVVAYARLTRVTTTIELATKALENIAAKAPKVASNNFAQIIGTVADSFQISSSDLTGRKRDKETALARQVAMYLLKQETSCTLVEIGKQLGGRTSSTVSHACEKIAADMGNSPHLKRKIFDTQKRINLSKNHCSDSL